MLKYLNKESNRVIGDMKKQASVFDLTCVQPE
jgi:hypothetical protein